MNSQQDTTKEMIQDSKNLKKVHSTIVDLMMKALLAPKGSILEYRDGDFVLQFGVKEIKSTNALFDDWQRTLPGKLKTLKKKKPSTRAKLSPDSLRNVYIPVFVTKPLKDFFLKNPEGFGGALTSQISESFKYGFMLKMTINTMFHLYINHNKLQALKNRQYINFDDHMRRCFAETPVGFVNISKDGKKYKVPAEEVGVKESTVEAIAKKEDEEDIAEIKDGSRLPISSKGCYTFHFFSITSLNSCAVGSISKFGNPSKYEEEYKYLQDVATQKDMLNDFIRIKRRSDEINPKLTAKRLANGIKSPNRSPNRSPARSPSKNGGVKSPSRLATRTSPIPPRRFTAMNV